MNESRAMTPKRPRDPNQLAHAIVAEAVGDVMVDVGEKDRPIIQELRAYALAELEARNVRRAPGSKTMLATDNLSRLRR